MALLTLFSRVLRGCRNSSATAFGFKAARILRFESLEDRRVLTTFTVTNLGDATVNGPGNAPGTLRQAIFDANAANDPDTIEFASNLGGDYSLLASQDQEHRQAPDLR